MRPSSAQCPYCGAQSTSVFHARDWNQRSTNETFGYRECRRCSLIFIDPIPEDIGRYYVNEQYGIPDSPTGFEQRANAQQWKLDILRGVVAGGRLVEIGPATGEFGYLASRGGFAVTLLEMDPACCHFLSGQLGLDVKQTSDPAAVLGSMKNVNALCIWQAIEHIPMFWKVLQTAVTALASGGVLLVSTPNPRSLQARILRRYWPHIDAPRHLYLIPQQWMRDFAVGAGLSIELDTTRDAGSLGLNYYGWYLAVRNLLRRDARHETVHRWTSRITRLLASRESVEGRGCSYTVALRKGLA